VLIKSQTLYFGVLIPCLADTSCNGQFKNLLLAALRFLGDCIFDENE
jgi:hypothetical protein